MLMLTNQAKCQRPLLLQAHMTDQIFHQSFLCVTLATEDIASSADERENVSECASLGSERVLWLFVKVKWV